MGGCRYGMVNTLVEIASILCSISQSNPRGAAHACSGNSFRGGVSPRFTLRPKGQSTVEYVLIIAIIVLVVLIAGPWVSSAIRNQFNLVAGTLGNGISKGSWDSNSTGGGNGSLTDADIVDPVHGIAFAVYSEDDHSLMFYKRKGLPKVGDMLNSRRVAEVYTGFEDDWYEFVATDSSSYGLTDTPWAPHLADIKTVRVVDGGIAPSSLRVWFADMTSLESADLAKLDTSRCVKMSDAFFCATALTSLDLTSWDVSNVSDFGCMFQGCYSLCDIDLRNWVARPKVSGLFGMFFDCGSLESLDLSGFDLSDATSANKMFGRCVNLSKVSFGSKWSWVVFDDGEGTDSLLPVPSRDYMGGADGKWYSVTTGKGYAPADIPTGRADAYVASRSYLH